MLVHTYFLTCVYAQPSGVVISNIACKARHNERLCFVDEEIANKLGNTNVISSSTTSYGLP